MKTSVLGWLFGSIFVLSSCKSGTDGARVTKIMDLKRMEVAVWHLDYDYRGRLSAYGNTPVEYGRNEIRIGRMDWDYRGEQLLSAAYFFSMGEVFRSEARCLWMTDSSEVEVYKEVDYEMCGDTIKMESTYLSVPDGHPVRQVFTRYVYDDGGNLKEIISRYVKANHETSACHSYYSYDKNVQCTSNLNMQAYFVDAEGPDTFFYLLLRMADKFRGQKLPNRIHYCVNHGKSMYDADGLYRLDGELLDKGEVISDDIKLKARLEFGYSE